MDYLTIATVNGSYVSPSKTGLVLEAITREITTYVTAQVTNIEVHGLGPGFTNALFRQHVSAEINEQIRLLESADVVVAGTPVFQASYSAMFKHIFDLVDPKCMINKPVFLCAVGGSERHALVIEHMLRPLFSYLKAWTAPAGIYAGPNDFDDKGNLKADLDCRIKLAVRDIVNCRGFGGIDTAKGNNLVGVQ